jgi:phosphate transport system substrate-binding protein
MKRFVAPMVKALCGNHTKIAPEITMRGSGFAASGLAHRECNVAVMSREMTFAEKAAVKRATKHQVLEFVIAKDAILILVNKENPVQGITLPQLDVLFGTKGLAGYKKPLATWGDLGATGSWASLKIMPYGILEERNGTVEEFRRIVLRGGPLRRVGNIKYPETEFGQLVAADRGGISYSIDHAPSNGARALAVASKEGAPFVAASRKTVGDDSYPLSRPLYAYLCDPTDRPAVEFIRFALSREGQKIVAANSASPIPADLAEKQLKQLSQNRSVAN